MSESVNNDENKFQWYFNANELNNTGSRKTGMSSDNELLARQKTAAFIQEVGQRLKLHQLCINTAIVYVHRFFQFHSFTDFNRSEIAVAALFLSSKCEGQPRKLQQIICSGVNCLQQWYPCHTHKYLDNIENIIFNEQILVQTIGFSIAVKHPHTQILKTCNMIRACRDLAMTAYFLATNTLHLTTFCLKYKPHIVAAFCVYLACKWGRWLIPPSVDGKEWYWYIDNTITVDLLEQITTEYLNIYEKSPTKFKEKLNELKMKQTDPKSIPTISMQDLQTKFELYSIVNTLDNTREIRKQPIGQTYSSSDASRPSTSHESQVTNYNEINYSRETVQHSVSSSTCQLSKTQSIYLPEHNQKTDMFSNPTPGPSYINDIIKYEKFEEHLNNRIETRLYPGDKNINRTTNKGVSESVPCSSATRFRRLPTCAEKKMYSYQNATLNDPKLFKQEIPKDGHRIIPMVEIPFSAHLLSTIKQERVDNIIEKKPKTIKTENTTQVLVSSTTSILPKSEIKSEPDKLITCPAPIKLKLKVIRRRPSTSNDQSSTTPTSTSPCSYQIDETSTDYINALLKEKLYQGYSMEPVVSDKAERRRLRKEKKAKKKAEKDLKRKERKERKHQKKHIEEHDNRNECDDRKKVKYNQEGIED